MKSLEPADHAILWGAVLMFLAIVIGAFGSHAMADLLQQRDSQKVFEVANRYHFYHALGLLICGQLWRSNIPFKWGKHCSVLLLLGTILFSGSLYILAITDLTAVGVLTPVGGVLLLSGWGLVIGDLLLRANQVENDDLLS